MEINLQTSAIYYAKSELKVFPLSPNTKDKQVLASWKNEATNDISQIKKWWFQNPNFNIGIVTGNGLIVIDIDIKNNKDGTIAFNQFKDKFPKTMIVQTPTGGYHYYYFVDREIKNKVNLYDGIDIRGDGGYIVGAPSLINNKSYTIINNNPIAQANDEVYNFLEKIDFKTKTVETHNNKIQQGQRNDTLFKMACVLYAKELSINSILAALKEENNTKCVPPLSDKEVERICESVKNQFEKRGPQKYDPDDELSTRLISLNDIEEKELEWIIPNLIPKNQITVFAGDGGVGKTSLWSHIASKLSTGEPLFFEESTDRTPLKIVYFSSEDPSDSILKKKLVHNKADLSMIKTIMLDDSRLQRVKFDSRFLKNIISDNRPDIIIFDPLQSFLPENTNMSARNKMREAMNHLLVLAQQYQVTFFVMAHTNKKSNVSGRERAADSADIWDIARSFLFVGVLNEDMKYLSNEKNNYARLQKTYLFSIENDVIVMKGITDNRDDDFQMEKLKGRREKTTINQAEDYIVDLLKNQKLTSEELDKIILNSGYSAYALKNAKANLIKDKIIDYIRDGSNRGDDVQKTIYYLVENKVTES